MHPMDGRIAGLAASKQGVLTRPQLFALGLSASGVDRRVWAGRLHRLHRGADLTAAGWRVIRVTYGRLLTQPRAIGAQLARLLR
jgi:hypothetical protein